MAVIFVFKNLGAYNFACTDHKTYSLRSCKGTSWTAWGFAEYQYLLFLTVNIPTSFKPCLSREQHVFTFSCHRDHEPVFLIVSALLLNSRNKHWHKMFLYRTSRSISFMTHPAGVLQINMLFNWVHFTNPVSVCRLLLMYEITQHS